MGYWLRGYEGERNNYCFSKIQLVGQKISRLDIFHKLKLDFLFYPQNIIIWQHFSLLVGYNI